MACRTVQIPGYGVAIACSRARYPRIPRCVVCNVPQTMATLKLCDGPALRGKGTCSAWVCVEHAEHVEPDTDYCPRHASR